MAANENKDDALTTEEPVINTRIEVLSEKLEEILGNKLVSNTLALGEITIEVMPENYLAVCKTLRDDEAFGFEILIDLCGVDYSAYGSYRNIPLIKNVLQ